ncbi:MAG: preprotein translocase subunit SecY [bacterium]|nr:preprotein translocase subunit SecY [bacterium]
MLTKVLQVFRIAELRTKILTVLGLLVAFRLFAAIPIPGVDAEQLRNFFSSNQLLGFLNIFSGGGLSNLSVAMLGVGPYITATIIMQLLTMVFPNLKKLYYEEGPAGRAKFNRISRYLTVPLAALQGYGFLNLLISQKVLQPLDPFGMVQSVILIVTGTLILMWIGEIISEQKIGNGISLIIFAGIVSGLPQFFAQLYFQFRTATFEDPTKYIVFALLSVLVVAGVVFINEGERKVPISYARRVRGTKLFGGVSSYLPLKVNQAGVIPIIFAISLLLFPQFFAQIISPLSPALSAILSDYINRAFNNPLIYSFFYFALVVVFTFFYTAVTFDPAEISKNLQQSGGFVPGIRPGAPTGEFLKRIIHRITLPGAFFLGAIAIMPNLVQLAIGSPLFQIGGAALLIVVAVALETIRQIDSQLTVREYEGL